MVSFKMFAGTDVGLRDNNEDNFAICPDLTSNEWIMPADHQQVIPLGECGCLMVVADGMGGQNAGEVASAIAIDTVQKMFAPGCLTDDVMSKPSTIKDYLRTVISKADLNVKKYSQGHPEAEGLGSTIVMAWAIGETLYVGWLGDSRAYSYMPGQGVMRLSKDHSYVQQLVDKGVLTDIEAMNHPNSNIITRSLGDMAQKARADVGEFPLEEGEIILLCSDGLCGVCTDDEIANVLSEESDDLQICRERLTGLALENGGSDNITISLMQVVSADNKGADSKPKYRIPLWSIISGSVVLLAIALFCVFGKGLSSRNDLEQGTDESVRTVNRIQDNSKRHKQKQDTEPVEGEKGIHPVGSDSKALTVKSAIDSMRAAEASNPTESNSGGSVGTQPVQHQDSMNE